MKKFLKIIISSLLVSALMIGVGTVAFAEEDTSNKLTQKLFKQPKGLAACELQAAGPLVLP